MRLALQEQMKEIEDMLLKMGAEVEEMLSLAITSLLDRDVETAKKVIKMDELVDTLEIDIENKTLILIATQNPLASDLRKISSIGKIITDLERIGDHCVNIAKVTCEIGGDEFVKPLKDIPQMASIVKTMIRKSLDSYIEEDVELAKQTAIKDDEVDFLYERVYTDLLNIIASNGTVMSQVIHLLLVGRYLERIADHSTNICERVIYMVSGERILF
ncbi:MAG: phosphate signaling complex protein PhoU [Acidaminobacteraceae bacterium]